MQGIGRKLSAAIVVVLAGIGIVAGIVPAHASETDPFRHVTPASRFHAPAVRVPVPRIPVRTVPNYNLGSVEREVTYETRMELVCWTDDANVDGGSGYHDGPRWYEVRLPEGVTGFVESSTAYRFEQQAVGHC